MSLDPLCNSQVHVSVYCARRIPAHLWCTHCLIMLHISDICFLPCICLWQILKIHTSLCVVVGPGFVSTSPAFMWSSDSHPVGPHGRLAKKPSKLCPHCWARGFNTFCAAVCDSFCDSSSTHRLCRLEHNRHVVVYPLP